MAHLLRDHVVWGVLRLQLGVLYAYFERYTRLPLYVGEQAPDFLPKSMRHISLTRTAIAWLLLTSQPPEKPGQVRPRQRLASSQGLEGGIISGHDDDLGRKPLALHM
jgi:hypothetical protein